MYLLLTYKLSIFIEAVYPRCAELKMFFPALKHYRFSLAFKNSNEEDYVTEKYFQSLVASVLFDLMNP